MILTEASLREPLRQTLATRARRTNGYGVASAVLLPLFEENGETRLWLLRRAEGLRKHAGQVALPGGKRDPDDASPIDTALREADEEIGLSRSAIDVLGQLDDFGTPSGFNVTPVVGWMSAGFVATPSDAEVARVFSVPLSLFFGKARGFFPRIGHDHDGEFVWGITLAIVRSLLEVIRTMDI